jgi:plasmid stabilization system protein ParE
VLKDFLADRFSDSWRLLSETTQFLSRTPVFSQHEEQLRSWRQQLQSAGKNAEASKKIRDEIIELRKLLRHEGYDLSLAGQRLTVDIFRNDTALGSGFRRVVIFFCENGAYWLSGDENHITLDELLERQMDSVRKNNQNQASFRIHSKHYLWYRRSGNELILSGSDTETKEDFERLKAMTDANSLVILTQLKGLK